jgi:hypothetical protein
MRSPFTAYNNQKNKEDLRMKAFNFFEEKYFKKPFEPYDFLETEERFLVNKLKFFIPGRIYTFQYDPIYKDFLSYYDKRPMVLVHSQYVSSKGNLIVQGLNLNFLPEFQRVQTMEIFSKTFKDDLAKATQEVDKNQVGILANAWKILTDWMSTIKIFNVAGKIGYQFAFRNYAVTNITEPVIIELEDWPMIPYFIPKEFEGASPQAIWSDYLKIKDELAKKEPNEAKLKRTRRKYSPPGS